MTFDDVVKILDFVMDMIISSLVIIVGVLTIVGVGPCLVYSCQRLSAKRGYSIQVEKRSWNGFLYSLLLSLLFWVFVGLAAFNIHVMLDFAKGETLYFIIIGVGVWVFLFLGLVVITYILIKMAKQQKLTSSDLKKLPEFLGVNLRSLLVLYLKIFILAAFTLWFPPFMVVTIGLGLYFILRDYDNKIVPC